MAPGCGALMVIWQYHSMCQASGPGNSCTDSVNKLWSFCNLRKEKYGFPLDRKRKVCLISCLKVPVPSFHSTLAVHFQFGRGRCLLRLISLAYLLRCWQAGF